MVGIQRIDEALGIDKAVHELSFQVEELPNYGDQVLDDLRDLSGVAFVVEPACVLELFAEGIVDVRGVLVDLVFNFESIPDRLGLLVNPVVEQCTD